VPHEPVEAPWQPARSCVHADTELRLASRGELADEPTVSGVDAGFELGELARHLLNRPYSSRDEPAPESRPVVTALLFDPV
jgi:hypothetical protein